MRAGIAVYLGLATSVIVLLPAIGFLVLPLKHDDGVALHLAQTA